MQSNAHRETLVVKRDDKEARLTQFILSQIASGRVNMSGEWCVLALSIDSPVVAAVKRVVRDLGEAWNLEIRVILIGGDRTSIEGFDDVKSCDIRVTHTSRLLDAHEQLLLGHASSWTGDCMRRNPRERDAFETFGTNHFQLATWTRKSFERIWSMALPVTRHDRIGHDTQTVIDVDGHLAADIVADEPAASATSRN